MSIVKNVSKFPPEKAILEDINDLLDIIISESKYIRDLSNSILRLSELDFQNVIIKK